MPTTAETLIALQNSLEATLTEVTNQIATTNGKIDDLDTTYATDSDLAAKIAGINTAWANADSDVQALIGDKVSTAAATALAGTAETNAKAHADTLVQDALAAMTAKFDAATAALQAL